MPEVKTEGTQGATCGISDQPLDRPDLLRASSSWLRLVVVVEELSVKEKVLGHGGDEDRSPYRVAGAVDRVPVISGRTTPRRCSWWTPGRGTLSPRLLPP